MIDLILNQILFERKHVIFVMIFIIIGLINDAYAAASYGILPRYFTRSEVTLTVYVATSLFSVISFGLGIGLKLAFTQCMDCVSLVDEVGADESKGKKKKKKRISSSRTKGK